VLVASFRVFYSFDCLLLHVFFILCCFVRSFVTMTDGLPPRPSVCYYRLIHARCRMQNEDKNAGKMHKCIKLYSVGQNSGATDS